MHERPWTLACIEPSDSVARAFVVVDRGATDPARPFLTVDETDDAVGYLGCLADAHAEPIQWLVLWLAKSPEPGIGGDALDLPASNLETLRRWSAAWRPWDARDRWNARGRVGPSLSISGSDLSGPVLLLDRTGAAPAPLNYGRERLPLALCTDDALLDANDLPRYSASMHRFLVARPANGNPRFVWLSGPAQPDGIPSVADAAEQDPSRILFNAGSGLIGAGPIRMTPFDPVAYPDYSALLHGESLRSSLRLGTAPRPERAELEGASSAMLAEWLGLSAVRMPAVDAGRLFGSGDPRALRELEACYLRVRCVVDMVSSVREAVERSGTPLFNVSPESFSVDSGARRDGLPFLWQSRVRLSRPGVARTFTVESDPPLRLFARPASAVLESLVPVHDASAFLAEALVLDVGDAGPKRAVLKLQMVPRQTVSVSETDLLRFTLRVGEHHVPILARPLRSMIGRQPFEARSLPFVPPDSRAIKAGASVSMPVETVPLQGTPHDLYALFVLACRMLLAGGHPTGASSKPSPGGPVLGAAADASGKAAAEEAETLAQLRAALGVDDEDTGATRSTPDPAGQRAPLFPSPAKLSPLLYPAPLRASDGAPLHWPEGIPPGLWSDLLRALGSMRPGWPGCSCRNLADFDPELPARVFDAPLAALESVARRLQVMLLGERAIDAEIRQAAIEVLRG